ncbi:NADH-quinone oxidoreductase subunit J [bacterium]|nr:NADH-quinone oxidoreductase subunit J [bacterium]
MINNPIIFYIASFLIIMSTFGVLFSKNVIYSLLSAIVVFFTGAIFFYILGSEYNAIIQAAVYGLAVPIIIGVSIMFTSLKKDTYQEKMIHYILIIASGIFILAFVYLLMMSMAMNPNTFNIREITQVNFFDVMSAFAKGIFINYVWAFELISLLLTIVIVGITVIKRRGV